MSPADIIRGQRLSDGLEQLGITIEEATQIFDQRRNRVFDWIHGHARTPTWVFAMLAMLTLPGARDLAKAAIHHVNEEEHNANVD